MLALRTLDAQDIELALDVAKDEIGSGHCRRFAFEAKLHQSDLFLRFRLRFIRCNKRTNFGCHIQQLEPLLFVQGHGEAPHGVD